MNKIKNISVIVLAIIVSACATPSQNVYDFREAGQSTIVEFGRVINVREIKIKGENTGVGAIAGGVAGAGVGSNIGGGDGQVYSAIGGALVGAVAGGLTEQALQNKTGIEYTIVTEHKKFLTIPQYIAKGEEIFRKGDRVMVQTSGSYQRVLSTKDIADTVKGVKAPTIVD